MDKNIITDDNPIYANVTFLYTLKFWFPDVFRGYRNGTGVNWVKDTKMACEKCSWSTIRTTE